MQAILQDQLSLQEHMHDLRRRVERQFSVSPHRQHVPAFSMENQLHAGSSIWALRSAANEKIGISAVQPDLKAALLKDIVRITVTDDRPGLPGSLRTLVLEPFFKADTARTPANRSGFGLGLSIVDDIVRAHGGTIELLNGAPHGLVARMDLPAAGYPLA